MKVNNVNQQSSGIIKQNNITVKNESEPLHFEDKYKPATNDEDPSKIRSIKDKLFNKTERVSTIWSASVDAYSYSEPALTESGMLVTTNQQGTVFCIDSKTGERKWKYETCEKAGYSPAAGKDGRAYVSTPNGRLLCLDEKDGEKKWEIELKHKCPLAIAEGEDDCLFFVDGTTSAALDAKTGNKLWEKNDILCTSTKGSILTLSDGTVCFDGVGGNLYAFDGKSGNSKWKFKHGGQFTSGLALSKDNDIYFVGPLSQFYGVSGKTGEIKFKCEAGDVTDAPAISPDGERAYVINSQEKIEAVDLKTGKKLWETQCGDFPHKIAAGIDGSAYVGLRDGTIQALDGKSGVQKWVYTDEDAYIDINASSGTSGLKTGPDGTIYYSGLSGKIIAIRDGLLDPDFCKIPQDKQGEKQENEDNNPSIKPGGDFVDVGGVKLPVRKKNSF